MGGHHHPLVCIGGDDRGVGGAPGCPPWRVSAGHDRFRTTCDRGGTMGTGGVFLGPPRPFDPNGVRFGYLRPRYADRAHVCEHHFRVRSA